MQNLDVISVNIWQILISLLNLYLLFLIFKKFLFKPVKNVLEKREKQLNDQYAEAERAEALANENRKMWEEKLSSADKEANAILQTATENAKYRGEKIVEEAQARADGMIRTAKAEIDLERRKANDGIKREIVEVSETLTEKMLNREINREDHKVLIDSFIEGIGEGND